jgi:hypothetical protein
MNTFLTRRVLISAWRSGVHGSTVIVVGTEQVEIIDPASGAHRMELGVPTKANIPNDRSRGQEDASDVVCGLHLFKESSSG